MIKNENLCQIFFHFAPHSFRIDPTIRHSFWTLFIGGTIFWVNSNGLNQNMMQRYMALKDVKTARRGQMIYVVGVSLMIFLCVYNGLLLYATYHDCDPLTTKLAKAKDQMLPLLVMEILRDIPGLSGLFIAGVFSAALSSLSTGLNSMSAVVLEDFCKPFMKNGISERASNYVMRGTVLVLGILSVALVYVVEHMGSVLQLSMSVLPACFGPMLGVYLVGFTLPWIGKRAALIGAVTACITMMVIVFKAQAEIATGQWKFQHKPLSVDGCDYGFNRTALMTSTVAPDDDDSTENSIFHMSYLYYTLMGSSIAFVTSIVSSCVVGFQNPDDVDPRLLVPFLRPYFASSKSSNHRRFKGSNGRETVIHTFETSKEKQENTV